MSRVCVPVLGLLALLGAGLRSPAQENEAKAIIEKAIKAHGGEDKLAKLHTAAIKMKGAMQIMGFDISFTGETIYQLPNKYKNKMELEAAGKKVATTQVFDGDKAWMIVMDKVIDIEGDQLKAIREEGYAQKVETLVPLLKEKEFELIVLGAEKVNNRPAVGIRVKAKGQKEIDLSFDKETGLLVRVARISYDGNIMKEAAFETIYSDFKDFNGLKHASKAIINQDGKKYMELEFTQITPLDKIDPKEFVRPL